MSDKPTSTASYLTITLNPAVDHTLFCPDLSLGEVHTVDKDTKSVGGKGINVATSLRWNAQVNIAVTGFLGTDNKALFQDHFQTQNITDHFVYCAGETRTNFKIVSKATDGRQQNTDLNLQGFTVSDAQKLELLSRVGTLSASVDWVVISGSLPRNVDADYLVQLIHVIKENGTRIACDLSGKGLKSIVDLPVDLIKPNDDELLSVFDHEGKINSGGKQATEAELISFLRILLDKGHKSILLSLGEAGAWLATLENNTLRIERGAIHKCDVVSTVGAGDSTLAGYLLHHNDKDALQWAMAFGGSAVTHHQANINQNPSFNPQSFHTLLDNKQHITHQ